MPGGSDPGPSLSADPTPDIRRGSNTRARAAAAGAGFALLLALVGGVAYLNRADGDDVTTDPPSTLDVEDTVVDTQPPATEPPNSEPTTTEPPTTVAPTTTLFPPGCPPPDGSASRQTVFTSPPPTCIDPTASYTATIATSKGTMQFALDVANAPVTVNNFVSLARFHFYDGLPFHRVVPGFVLQTGDPDGSGGGGPGYTIPDELPVGRGYKVGSLAMANAGPGTAGSQFFIVSGADGVSLDPDYALFGQLISGIEVIRAIDAVGAPDPDPPTEQVVVSSITITETPAGATPTTPFATDGATTTTSADGSASTADTSAPTSLLGTDAAVTPQGDVAGNVTTVPPSGFSDTTTTIP